MYLTRKKNIEASEQLEGLTQASGELYSAALTYFWRVVRKKDIWLSYYALAKLFTSKKMHAHSADAAVESFFHGLKSWKVRKKNDPRARPPHKRRKFYKIQWKKSAIKIKNGELILSNGRGNKPLVIPWKWNLPVLVECFNNGIGYVLTAIYVVEAYKKPLSNKQAGIDLGEVHPAAAYDGESVYLVNGRYARSLKQLRNKTIAYFQQQLSTKKKGSHAYRKFKKSLRRQLRKIDNQLRNITHKQTTQLVSTLYQNGVQTIVIGDIRTIRIRGKNLGKKSNQKIHQMHHGRFRHMLSYKAELHGMNVTLIDESYTSQECPSCGKRTKPTTRNYRCSCGFSYHRDGVGALNILKKYRGEDHVVGVMASPISLRYSPHMKCSL